MSLIIIQAAKQSKTTPEPCRTVGIRCKTAHLAEMKGKAGKDGAPGAEPQLSLPGRCEFHMPILIGMISQGWKDLAPMERFNLEVPSEHFAFHIRPDTGHASTHQRCTCMIFAAEVLEISDDERE
jgi:hypothetical protein